MDLLYFWGGCALVFLIVEMLTATFYGLSLSIASGIVALYVWYMGDTDLDIIQWILFASITFLASFTLPRLLIPGDSSPVVSQGLDAYIWLKRKVKLQGESFKITLDGVDYPIENEDNLQVWDQVEIISAHSIAFFVKKVQK
jgi:membrane protein implicated in regulation of membrane protease activity